MEHIIFVSTYCVITSYGSILQSYSLKKILEKLGKSSVIISKKSSNDINQIQYYRKNSSLKNIIVNLNLVFKKRLVFKRLSKNKSFINENIDLFEYNSYDELLKKTLDSNTFLAGSDQIFRPSLCDPVFFLDFVPPNAKKISYAASMGSTVIPSEKENEFFRLLSNFDFLSLRESDTAEFARRYTNQCVQVHIDPTFLMNSDEWRLLEKEYCVKGEYILLYPLYWDRSLNDQLRALHKKTRLPILLISDSLGIYHQKKIHDVGVEQFLWLIDHAEYVVTSSFHGAALSIIYNKKTSIVVNPSAPSRLVSLASTLDYPVIPIDKLDSSEVDFDKVNSKIAYEKERSMSYLKQVLFNE